MSHIWRYAQIFKVTIDKYEAHITMNFGTQGSVLAQTVQASCDSIEVRYEIESADPPDKVAAVLRTSRNGCYVRQTIGRPGLFRDTNVLNGEPFNLDDYPPPVRSD